MTGQLRINTYFTLGACPFRLLVPPQFCLIPLPPNSSLSPSYERERQIHIAIQYWHHYGTNSHNAHQPGVPTILHNRCTCTYTKKKVDNTPGYPTDEHVFVRNSTHMAILITADNSHWPNSHWPNSSEDMILISEHPLVSHTFSINTNVTFTQDTKTPKTMNACITHGYINLLVINKVAWSQLDLT